MARIIAKKFEKSGTDVDAAGMREGSAREESMDRREMADDHLDKAPILPVKQGEAQKADHTTRAVKSHAVPNQNLAYVNRMPSGASSKPQKGVKEDTSPGGPMKGMVPANRGFVSASMTRSGKRNQSRVI